MLVSDSTMLISGVRNVFINYYIIFYLNIYILGLHFSPGVSLCFELVS